MHDIADCWVVIPAYYEAAVIGRVVADVLAVGPKVVVVDDCSADATGSIAALAGAHVVRHSINRGQGAALQTGMSYALRRGARCIVHFDADGQHQPASISRLVEPIFKGQAHAVLGSRFLSEGDRKKIPLERKLFLKGAILFTRLFSGIKLTDVHNGLRAFSREAAAAITITENGNAHASEILHEIARHAILYREVPVSIEYTAYSNSSERKARGCAESSMKRTIGVMRRLLWRNLFS